MIVLEGLGIAHYETQFVCFDMVSSRQLNYWRVRSLNQFKGYHRDEKFTLEFGPIETHAFIPVSGYSIQVYSVALSLLMKYYYRDMHGVLRTRKGHKQSKVKL